MNSTSKGFHSHAISGVALECFVSQNQKSSLIEEASIERQYKASEALYSYCVQLTS